MIPENHIVGIREQSPELSGVFVENTAIMSVIA